MYGIWWKSFPVLFLKCCFDLRFDGFELGSRVWGFWFVVWGQLAAHHRVSITVYSFKARILVRLHAASRGGTLHGSSGISAASGVET